MINQVFKKSASGDPYCREAMKEVIYSIVISILVWHETSIVCSRGSRRDAG